MENIKSILHVLVPHLDDFDNEITPKDQLIYACIRRYMNGTTKIAFPSLETIKKDCGASVPTIRKSLKILDNADYLRICKRTGPKGKLQNVYAINT